MSYWYNVRTGTVEVDGQTSHKEDLMGPYATEAEASCALERAAERTEAWEEEDRRRAEEKARERGEDPDDDW